MKLLVLLSLLAWLPFTFAQGSSAALGDALAQMPSCAIPCLFTAVAQSSCQADNTTCLCADMTLQQHVEACVLQSCTVREALTAKNTSATMCNEPIRNRSESLRIANIVVTIIGSISALIRVSWKAFREGMLGWDDYTIIFAVISCIPSSIIIDRGLVPNGVGRDVWTVPFDHITKLIRWLFIIEILYFVQLALVKITLLFFFLRIFPRPIMRRLLSGTIIFTAVWALVYVIVGFCQCQPMSFFWTSWDKTTPGKCMNINAMAWSQAAISIILDFWMLALPLFEVLQLRLSWQKKASITIMFCVGTFFTVVSILRLKTVVGFGRTQNPTYDQAEIIHWSNIEINVGLICASLPTFRVMLVRAFPKALGTSSIKKSSNQPYGARYGEQKTIGGSPMDRGTGKGANMSKKGGDKESAIYPQDLDEIHHSGENDEMGLVYMAEIEAKKPKVNSSSSSVESLA